MSTKQSFVKLIQLWGIVFLIGLGLSFIAIDAVNSYRDFRFRADRIRTDFTDRQKQIVKEEVDRVVSMIRYERAQAEELTKEKIKARVYEAYAIAENIYLKNKDAESQTNIQQMILDALRPIRFENGSGYYFITRLDGVDMLFADRPKMEGLNLLNVRDAHGQYVIKKMIAIANKAGEGFTEYYWTKPGEVGKDFKKISFIKRFDPYDWIIGAGLYVSDVERKVEADLLSAISRIRYGNEGYIFVNNFNGDALVSNGKIFTGTQKLWEVFPKEPEKAKAIFEKEYEAALKPQGDYIYYSWIKLSNSDVASPKVSFIYGMLDFRWIVGAGVYLDDVEGDIVRMQTELNNQIKGKILYFVLISIFIIGLFSLCFRWLSSRLSGDINFFLSFFSRAALSDEVIDREGIRFSELDRMAEYANKMLTDRKQAEQALRENEERFRKIYEHMAVGLARVSLDFQIESANEAYCSILGYREEELIGKHLGDITHPEDLEENLLKQSQLARGEIDHFRMEKRFIHKEGQTIYGILDANLVRDVRGNPIYFLGSVVDITDRKLAEEERQRLEGELRQSHKMEAVGTLAGGIAHEFNNILGIILGNAELAEVDISKSNPARLNLSEIKRASLRARDVVRQLLAFSRKSEERLQLLDPAPVVKDCIKFLNSSLPTSIEIRSNIADGCHPITADPTQVHQVLLNLGTNAAHAMEEAGGVLEFTLQNITLDAATQRYDSELQPGQYVMLQVRDSGCGIPAEVLNRIFDPYFTTKGVGKGTGLGLSVVHGIIEACGGSIRVESIPGSGTTFEILFPAAEAEEKSRPELRVEQDIPTGNERILFIDDEQALAKLGRLSLEKLGYAVQAETNPNKALDVFASNPEHFDLIITDTTMPGLAGDQLIKKILQIRPEMKIILCTGYSERIDEETACSIGAKAYVLKPLDSKQLAMTVRNVLRGRANY